MDTQKSGKFFVGSIVTFLIVLLLVKVLLATMQGVANNVVTADSMADEDVVERIKPVAEAYVGETPVVVAPPVVAEVATSGDGDGDGDGEKIVTQVCALCHSTGMMNSPKLGNAGDWAPRIEKGVDTLYSNAINGINMMPARGGNPNLSDDDVKAAVDHMVSQAQ